MSLDMLKKINLTKEGTTKERTEFKRTETFRQGEKDFKENKVNFFSFEPTWVKKFFNTKEWNLEIQNLPSYCFLEKAEKGVVAAFVAVGVPPDCELASTKDLLSIDEYRKSRNILPLPLT